MYSSWGSFIKVIKSVFKKGTMRKLVLGLLAGCLLAGGVFAAAPGKMVAFSLNGGLQLLFWSDVISQHVTLDFRAGFRLGKSFEISPEIMYAGYGHSSHLPADRSRIYPGVIANFVSRHFFAGVGVTFPIVLDGGSAIPLAPKGNIGLVLGRWMMTAYLVSSALSGETSWAPIFGLSIGYRF